RRATGAALAVALLAAPIAVVAAARLRIRGHAHHQHRRKQHARSHHGLRPPLVVASLQRARAASGSLRCVRRMRAPRTRSAPSPVYGGGVGRGCTARILVHAPSLTLPRKRGREYTEGGEGSRPSSRHLTNTLHEVAAPLADA